MRELRDNLSRYLERVKAGSEVVVTDHGQPVAYLVPRPRSSKLAELIAAGRARAPQTYRRRAPQPIEFRGTDSELDKVVRDSR